MPSETRRFRLAAQRGAREHGSLRGLSALLFRDDTGCPSLKVLRAVLVAGDNAALSHHLFRASKAREVSGIPPHAQQHGHQWTVHALEHLA